MISQATIEAVRERANLVDLISETVSLKRQGSGFVGLCPFHAEKSPSFSVRSDGTYFHCFGCGASGNIFTYVMQQRGLTFPEAVEDLASRYGISVQREGKTPLKKDSSNRPQLYRINSLAVKFFTESLKSAEPVVRDYLKSRAISAEALSRFAIGYAPRSWNSLVKFLKGAGINDEDLLRSNLVRRSPSGELYDVFRGRIIFPVWIDSKRVCAFGGRIVPAFQQSEEGKSAPKYLNSAESPIYQKSKVFFGMPQTEGLRQSNELYLVEGYMDVVGLWQAGVRNVLATCGTAVTAEHARRLSRLVRRLTILFDGDSAGRAAAARCFENFINTGLDVEVAFLEQGQDPDDLGKAHGDKTAQALKALPTSSLLQAYLMGLVTQYGASKVEELGAANKGTLCATVANQLRGVKNGVEREELLQQAARLLMIEASQLKALSKGERPKVPELVVTKSEEPEQPLGTIVNKEIAQLPKIDREILTAVMVHKEDLCEELLRDYELCAGLDPCTLLFVTNLHKVVAAKELDVDAKRERIKALLEECGVSWLKHWRAAYEMASQAGVDFRRSFIDCKKALGKLKLNQELARLRKESQACSDVEEKLRLSQDELALSKRLQSL